MSQNGEKEDAVGGVELGSGIEIKDDLWQRMERFNTLIPTCFISHHVSHPVHLGGCNGSALKTAPGATFSPKPQPGYI